MSKEPKKMTPVDTDVLPAIKSQYYSIIVAPQELSNRFLEDNQLDKIDIYGCLLTATLWRNNGQNCTGTNSIVEFLQASDQKYSMDVHFLIAMNSSFVLLSEKLSKHYKSLEATDRHNFYRKYEPILSHFIDKNGWPIKKDFINMFGGVRFNNMSQPPSAISTTKSILRCLSTCLDNMVLGVGDAPIYVPTVKDGIGKSLTFIALFKDHELYSYFKEGVSFVEDNFVYKDQPLNGKRKTKGKEASGQSNAKDITHELLNKLRGK